LKEPRAGASGERGRVFGWADGGRRGVEGLELELELEPLEESEELDEFDELEPPLEPPVELPPPGLLAVPEPLDWPEVLGGVCGGVVGGGIVGGGVVGGVVPGGGWETNWMEFCELPAPSLPHAWTWPSM
jgi:hypothetical protein